MSTNDYPSKQVILQRIRNRIIEVLDLFSDDAAFSVAVSNLELWADLVDEESLSRFGSPVFSDDELAEMAKVNAAWELAELNSAQTSKEWLTLCRSSKQALKVFLVRGMLSEGEENA